MHEHSQAEHLREHSQAEHSCEHLQAEHSLRQSLAELADLLLLHMSGACRASLADLLLPTFS